MPILYDYLDYRSFLKAWITAKAAEVKGIQSKLATAAGVSSTMISRILGGQKHLTPEQATELAEYLGFNDDETRYFILLVEIGRAGSVKLTRRLKTEAQRISEKVSTRIKNTNEIDDKIKSIYYSTWIYSAIRNIVATPGNHSVASLAERLGLPNPVMANAVQFLVEHKLCTKTAKGIQYASKKTHVDADSPFVTQHHSNWRHKALQKMEHKNSSHLFFTSPMSLSSATASEIRKSLQQAIADVMGKVEPSPSEVTYCLNVDWFAF